MTPWSDAISAYQTSLPDIYKQSLTTSKIPTQSQWLDEKYPGWKSNTGFGSLMYGDAYNKYVNSLLPSGSQVLPSGGTWQDGKFYLQAGTATGDTRAIDPSQMRIDPTTGLLVMSTTDIPSWLPGHGGGGGSGSWLGDVFTGIGDIGRVVTPALIGAAYGTAGLGALGAETGITSSLGAEAAGGVAEGGAIATPLTSTGLATGAVAPTGTALGVESTTAGIGAFGIGAGAESVPGYAGLNSAQQAAFSQMYGTGVGAGTAMDAATLGSSGIGMLGNAKDAYNAYNVANKAKSAYNMLTGSGQQGTMPNGTGGSGMAIDWGSLLGGLVGAGGTYLGNQSALDTYKNQAEQLANQVKFTPYSISSDIGQTYQDPTTGQMISKLDPRFAEQQQGMLGAVGTNLAASQADPTVAAKQAYDQMRQLSSFEEQQKQQALENRLQQQGMLGSTGGANQTRAMYDAMNQNNVNQQLQSVNLGQTLSNNAMTRANQAWTGAMAPTAAMSSQMGQSGQFGAANTSNQQFGAGMIDKANQAKAGLNMSATNSLFGSPSFNPTTGQQTSAGGVGTQIGNWLGGNVASGVGNWLGGNTTANSGWTGGADFANSFSNYQNDPYASYFTNTGTTDAASSMFMNPNTFTDTSSWSSLFGG